MLLNEEKNDVKEEGNENEYNNKGEEEIKKEKT